MLLEPWVSLAEVAKHLDVHVETVRRWFPIDTIPDDSPWKRPKDPMVDEWLTRVRWVSTVPEAKAKWFPGAFANRNVVCVLPDENTMKSMKAEFAVKDDEGGLVDCSHKPTQGI